MQRQTLSLAVIVLFLLPLLPLPPPSAARVTPSREPGNSENQTPSSSSDIQPISTEVPTVASEAGEATPVEVPAPPDYQEFTASPRAVALQWNRTRVFNNRNQSTDFAVTGETGMLYHEVNNFTRITTGKTKIVVEDYNPWDPSAPYLVSWGANDPVFIAFRIPPQRVAIDGFWIFVWGQNGLNGGLVNFTLYPAKPGLAPALTEPNLTAPVRWPALQAVIPSFAKDTGGWVWLNTDESSLFVNSASTYANTYYFAIWLLLSSATKVQPVLTYDDQWPDLNDESDSYRSWTPAYRRWDFFLNVSVIVYPYPTSVGMRVNGLPVQDVAGQPGKGVWQNWPSPEFNMTNAARLYDVTSSQPMLFFDVAWSASLYSVMAANTKCRVWTNKSTTDWEIRFNAAFPLGALGCIIIISIEKDWNVTEVSCNGLPFSSWTREDWETSGTWIVATNASSGSWLIRCEGPNYVADVEIQDQNGNTVTQVYAADWVTIYGYIRDPLGVNATNGNGYLVVYAPDESIHYSDLTTLYSEGVIQFWWSVWATVTSLGSYTLHVIWGNGTEAGMAPTTLEVVMSPTVLYTYEETPPPGEDVIKGQLLVFLFYYGDYMGYPLDNATVTVTNNTDPSRREWYNSKVTNYRDEGSPGFYRVWLPTDNATLGFLHDVTITFVQNCYEAQNHNRTFTIVTSTALIVLLQGHGLDNTTGVWRTAPEPLINESSTEFTFKLVTQAGIPIEQAVIHAYLVKGSGGNEKYRRLDWEELTSGGSPTSPSGRYNVTVDVRPVEGEAFHEGDEAFIIIYAVHPRYELAISDLIYVRPQPRPSFIDIPQEYRSINLYEDWSYPTISHPVILRVILRDALNGEDLSHGTVWAEIPGLGISNLTIATPGLGLYEIPSLSTHGLSAGNYIIIIRANARDFVDTLATVSLVIQAKQEIIYSIEADFPSTLPNQGMEWSLTILFQFEDAAAKMASLGTGRRTQPIPEGTKVDLEIVTASGSVSMPPEYVGSDGKVTFHGTLMQEGDYSFFISIAETESSPGLDHVQLEANGSAIVVGCVSAASYFRSILPSIALFAALIVLLPLGAFLTYRRAVSLPRRRRRLEKYQAIADTFSDVANLNRLLVLHKESGICIFDPFAEETRDATLVAGFLQAISTFGHDMVEAPGLSGKDKERASTLRELTYEGFRILIHDGRFVRNALVLSGKPSEQLRTRLENFTGEFEKRYHKEFDHWSGRVDQFNSASDLVEEIFLVSLRLPHRVRPRKPARVSLTPLEDDLYKLARELTKDREYIFIGQILSTYLITAKHDKLEALMALYQLRQKGCLVPWQLVDATGGTQSEAAVEAEPENSG